MCLWSASRLAKECGQDGSLLLSCPFPGVTWSCDRTSPRAEAPMSLFTPRLLLLTKELNKLSMCGQLGPIVRGDPRSRGHPWPCLLCATVSFNA